MNHDSPDPELQYMELNDSVVPNDTDTYEEEWLQELFSSRSLPGAETVVEIGPAAETLVEIGPVAETREFQGFSDEFISWIMNDNDDDFLGPFVATPPQLAENEIFDYMTTPPQQAEYEVHYDEDSLMEFLNATQQVTEPTTEFILSQPYELVQGEQQLIQPPSEPGFVEPFGSNNYHHYFTAPAVHNSPWALSTFPSTSAPIYYEPALSTTSSVEATVKGGEEPSVVIDVEGTKEDEITSNFKGKDQVEEQEDDGSEPLPKRMCKSHSGCERRRRDRMSDRIMQLRELVPGCKKIDKASVLEETCRYLKSLRDQVKQQEMFSLGCKMRMSMATGMNMAMVPFPAFIPVSTLQNPAITNAQNLGFYPPGYLQAENDATLQPSTSKNPGEMDDGEKVEKN